MILDTSALVAVFENEPERGALLQAMTSADSLKISSATLLETHIVLRARYGASGAQWLAEFLSLMDAQEVPFSGDQREWAARAFDRFGKGQGHKAQLNLGDCFAYGLAKATSEPLLCKGDDFTHTDVEIAWRAAT